MKQTGKETLPFNITGEQREKFIQYHFPNREDTWHRSEKAKEVIPPCTIEELMKCAAKVETGKAPGPDRIPPEAVKLAVTTVPDAFLRIFNLRLRSQEFSKIWKVSSVALIWKGKPPEIPSSFRTICMLSMVCKLFERIVKDRIEQELENGGNLSERQYGFRKGRSTIQAIEKVVQLARSSDKKWFVLGAVDVENAFNSATWSIILREMRLKVYPNTWLTW